MDFSEYVLFKHNLLQMFYLNKEKEKITIEHIDFLYSLYYNNSSLQLLSYRSTKKN